MFDPYKLKRNRVCEWCYQQHTMHRYAGNISIPKPRSKPKAAKPWLWKSMRGRRKVMQDFGETVWAIVLLIGLLSCPLLGLLYLGLLYLHVMVIDDRRP